MDSKDLERLDHHGRDYNESQYYQAALLRAMGLDVAIVRQHRFSLTTTTGRIFTFNVDLANTFTPAYTMTIGEDELIALHELIRGNDVHESLRNAKTLEQFEKAAERYDLNQPLTIATMFDYEWQGGEIPSAVLIDGTHRAFAAFVLARPMKVNILSAQDTLRACLSHPEGWDNKRPDGTNEVDFDALLEPCRAIWREATLALRVQIAREKKG